jgi:hypothetical protein
MNMTGDSLRRELFRLALCLVMIASLAGPVTADDQQPTPSRPPDASGPSGAGDGVPRVLTTPRPVQPSQAQVAAREPQSTSNIQLDLVITDTLGGKPVKKTVTMLISNGGNGSIRTAGSIPIPLPEGAFIAPGTLLQTPVQLNIDARASERGNRLINVLATFQFTPAAAVATERLPGSSPPELRQSIDVVLRSGKPLLVSRSADPITDRTVTVELTATIVDQ